MCYPRSFKHSYCESGKPSSSGRISWNPFSPALGMPANITEASRESSDNVCFINCKEICAKKTGRACTRTPAAATPRDTRGFKEVNGITLGSARRAAAYGSPVFFELHATILTFLVLTSSCFENLNVTSRSMKLHTSSQKRYVSRLPCKRGRQRSGGGRRVGDDGRAP